jgi:hypothetical protein
MSHLAPDEQMEAYTEAVKSGLYAKKSGLVGKYDNVRRYWEDEATRIFLAPHLTCLIERCQEKMRRVRVMDIGCGSADGYELLTGIRRRDADLEEAEVNLFTPQVLGCYTGVDLNEDLLAQADDIYNGDPKIGFRQADFTEGLPIEEDERPYDLYFSSFGTFSHHNEDETAVALLAGIAEQAEEHCLIVCDWLGRYSYEWQELWTADLSENRNMDYVVSYIYDEDEREARRDELQHLLLRLMSREEVSDVIESASRRSGVDITPLGFFDRSVLTGRHMDTGDYNGHAQPLRAAVNSLHEDNVRTDLQSLIFDYVPKPGFEPLNRYFERLQMCWNALVRYVQVLLHRYEEKERDFSTEPPPIPGGSPTPLRETMDRMRQVVEGIGWLDTGLPRENIIEPQLGYALRQLVMRLQEGRGFAHGLVGIFEVDKG